MINVTVGVSIRRMLADGRVYTLASIILPGEHQIQLTTSVTTMQASRTKQVCCLTSLVAPDRQITFAFDQSNLVTLTLHIPK